MNEKYLPLAATIAVFALLFVTGGLLYNNFFSTLVLGDILADNAFVIIAAIGTTFVILSGGIDLSIGSMIGFVGVAMASLDVAGWHPLASALLMIGFRRRLRRASRVHHRFLRDPAVHHHVGWIVPAARRLLHGQPRFRSPATSLRRRFRGREPSPAGRRLPGEFGDRHADCARRRGCDRPLDRLRRGRLRNRRGSGFCGADGDADAADDGQNIRTRGVVQRARRGSLRTLHIVGLSPRRHRRGTHRDRVGRAGRYAVDRGGRVCCRYTVRGHDSWASSPR